MLYLKASSQIQVLNEYDGQPGLYLKTFALNTKRNKNGWRVTWDSIKKNIGDFIGMPGILYNKCIGTVCDLDHTEGTTYEASVEAQKDYITTQIIDYTLDEQNETGYVIHKVNDPDGDFAKQVMGGEIKYVSPSVWPIQGSYDVNGTTDNGLPMIDAYDWKPIHIAFVNDPAFGDDAKITATCEGQNCQMRLLSARELSTEKRNNLRDSQFAYVDKDGVGHLPIHDGPHVRNALARFDQTDIPEDKKAAVKRKLCSAAKRFHIDSDFCKDAQLSADELAPLEQVPLLVRHKGHLAFVSVTRKMYDDVNKAIQTNGSLDAKTFLEISKNNSLNACTCSGSRSMEAKDLEAKLAAAEKATKDAEDKAKTAADKIKELESKIAKMEADAKDGDGDDDPEDDGGDDGENDNDSETKNKKTKKAKNAKSVVAKLQAKLAEPMIKEMLAARESQGATKEQLESFEKSLQAKGFEQVEEIYNNEKILIQNLSAKSEDDKVHLPFNGGSEALTAKSLEETFGEVAA